MQFYYLEFAFDLITASVLGLVLFASSDGKGGQKITKAIEHFLQFAWVNLKVQSYDDYFT